MAEVPPDQLPRKPTPAPIAASGSTSAERRGTEAIADHVLSHVFPGAIVLMHDGGGDRSQSVAALEIILRELSAKWYKFYNIFGN